jgi:hypothetical protein
MTDLINCPPHYTQGGVECIESMKACCTSEEFRGYLRLATLKYIWRLNDKGNPLSDAHKAQWYINRLVQELENE